MWVFTNKGFVSAVEHFDHKDVLVVRARRKECLISFFQGVMNVKPSQIAESDYPWRVRVSRAVFEDALLNQAKKIDYHNFKDSINKNDHDRKTFYMNVWAQGRMFERFTEWNTNYLPPKKKH